MQITDIRIRMITKEDSKLKAVASVTIDDAIAIHDIKIIDGTKGIFMVFPSRKTDDGFKDIVHPVSTEVRTMIISKVLAAYYDEVNKPAKSE